MLSPGTPFADRYRIDAEVGRGTFGVVYRAFDFVTSRDVAVKVLNPEANADEKQKHRLRREARVTAQMQTPHCVAVHEVAETPDGRAYIVMDLLEGHELRAILGGGAKLASERVIAIGSQILEAVGEAHRLGVVHRDLKPSNIYLCPSAAGDDDVKVLDFGIAKITGTADGSGLTESARLTTHGSALGTPVYMSPEQSRGEVPTPASDFYSIGVMLYEMLAGRPPFDDENPVRVMMWHNTEPVPPLPRAVAATPLGAAVLRALEKLPERRFATAEEFAAALTAFPAPTSTAITTPAKTSAAPPPGAATPPAPSTQPVTNETIVDKLATGTFTPVQLSGESPGLNRSLVIAVAAIILAVLLTAIGLGYWLNS